MITSPQTIQVRRDGVGHNATISWRMADRLWAVATSLRPRSANDAAGEGIR